MSLVCIPRLYCKPGKAAEIAKLLPINDSLTNQPKTLAYFFFSLGKNPNTIIGVELYSDKTGLKEHGSAVSFKEFGKAAGSLFEKQFSLDQAAPICGFLSKDTESASQILSDRSSIAVLVTMTCTSPENRTKFLEHATTFAKKVHEEKGTLSYYWSIDNKDPCKVYVFERYYDVAAVKAHQANAASFLKDIRGLVKSSEIEQGTPVAGFLKKEPSILESKEHDHKHHLAPPLLPISYNLSSDSHPATTKQNSSKSGNVAFTEAKNGIPQSIAHRGYKALFPENTLIALEGALKSGADGIETDVHLSRDGVVVISHDSSTLRCYGKPGNVWDQDFYGAEGMKTFLTVDEPHTRMPTLIEVLNLMTREDWINKWLLLDIKVDNQVEIIQAMADTLKVVNRDMSFWASRIVLGIWHHEFLPYCEQFLPELPITHIGLHTSYARSHFLKNAAVSSFNLQLFSLVTREQQAFVKDAHALGKPVYIWTVNDEQSMRFCMHLKVDAILSDDPSKTKSVQNEDLSEWNVKRDFWTWKRTLRSYMFNVLLWFVLMYRFSWKFRHLRSQVYMPVDIAKHQKIDKAN